MGSARSVDCILSWAFWKGKINGKVWIDNLRRGFGFGSLNFQLIVNIVNGSMDE